MTDYVQLYDKVLNMGHEPKYVFPAIVKQVAKHGTIEDLQKVVKHHEKMEESENGIKTV